MSSIDKINVGGVDFDINSSPTSVMASVETGTTATQPYAVGDYVIVGSTLHEVTSAIAIGDTFTEGTNISTSTSLGDEIKQINNDLTANSNKFEASYQNGKYGFMINGTFYEIGGGSMKMVKSGNITVQGQTNAIVSLSGLGFRSRQDFIVILSGAGFTSNSAGGNASSLSTCIIDETATNANQLSIKMRFGTNANTCEVSYQIISLI